MSHQGLIQGNTVSKLCIIQTVIEKGAVSKRQRSLIDGKIVSLVLMTRALVMQLPLISRLIIFHIGYCSIVHNGSNGNLCSHTLCYSESLNSIHFMTLTPRFFFQKIEMDWSWLKPLQWIWPATQEHLQSASACLLAAEGFLYSTTK